jgi:AbrB family looped-hinge helix DNA binding protein
MTLRKEVELGSNGRVVIPQEIREALEVKPGDKLVFLFKDGRLELTTRRAVVERLHGMFAQGDGRNLTQELLAERKSEIEDKEW